MGDIDKEVLLNFRASLLLKKTMSRNNPIHTESDSISKDIFDRYYRVITELLEKSASDTSKIPFENLQTLQKVVEAIERNVIDITSERKRYLEIVPTIIDLLESWLFVVDGYVEYSLALAYNLFAALSLIENISMMDLITANRFLQKIKNRAQPATEVDNLDSPLLESVLQSLAFIKQKNLFLIFEEFKRETEIQVEINDEKRNDSLRQLYTRQEINYFNLNPIGKITNTDIIEEIRHEAKRLNLYDRFESLFEFDDSVFDAVWDVKIVVNNARSYNASEIGFLLWSFAKAVESIEDVQVSLEKCSEGSKIFDLKIRIKSLASKVDLIQILKKATQGIQVYHTKKPIEELEKFEAETEKLFNETEKIRRETNNIQSEDNAEILNNLAVHDKVIDLQLKELDYQNKIIDLKMKQLELIRNASELMAEGFVQNNSDVQIYINNVLLISKQHNESGNTEITTGRLNLIDVEEKIEAKSTMDNEENTGFTDTTI